MFEVDLRATWATFNTKPEKIKKNLPRKSYIYFNKWNFKVQD